MTIKETVIKIHVIFFFFIEKQEVQVVEHVNCSHCGL